MSDQPGGGPITGKMQFVDNKYGMLDDAAAVRAPHQCRANDKSCVSRFAAMMRFPTAGRQWKFLMTVKIYHHHTANNKRCQPYQIVIT